MQGQPLLILLVEDNADHAELVMRSFREHRVANVIRHVDDGESALNYLFRRGVFAHAESSPRPDLVLLDLRMPRVDGFEVLRQVKASPDLHRLPVVVMTTSSNEADITRAYDENANSFVVKPADFSQFSRLIQDLGFYWLTWNQSPLLPTGRIEPEGKTGGVESSS
jgi:CheY-like chemotaxis protein